MSPRGREAAIGLKLSAKDSALIDKALTQPQGGESSDEREGS